MLVLNLSRSRARQSHLKHMENLWFNVASSKNINGYHSIYISSIQVESLGLGSLCFMRHKQNQTPFCYSKQKETHGYRDRIMPWRKGQKWNYGEIGPNELPEVSKGNHLV